MRLSKKALKKRFKFFNDLYFKSELVEPKFVVDGNRWTAGMFTSNVVLRRDNNGEQYASQLNDIRIHLSKFLIKNNKILNNILLHEMIHYYGYYLNEDIEGTHGKYFKKMARKVNKDGYHVQQYYKED